MYCSSKIFIYIRGMNINTDIFKIESNNLIPSRGKILISEPFLRDEIFGRSVILLVDHNQEGTMGVVMNKQLPVMLNEIIHEFSYIDDIPLYKGGPLGTDTLFYVHTLPEIPGALPIKKDLYLNGDFNEIKKYILQGNQIEGVIKFILGYSGWSPNQLLEEIQENTWIIGKGDITDLMFVKADNLWKVSLENLGSKYETWSRFPEVPSWN